MVDHPAIRSLIVCTHFYVEKNRIGFLLNTVFGDLLESCQFESLP